MSLDNGNELRFKEHDVKYFADEKLTKKIQLNKRKFRN